MLEISQNTIDLLDACPPQSIHILVDGVEGLTAITGADIMQGTFSVDRQGFPTGTVFIGEAPAHEVAFTLSNRDGRFDGVNLDGARLNVIISLSASDGATALLNLGVFNVDSAPRRGYGIEVSALDNVSLLDRPWESALTFPATLLQIASEACALCGLTLATTDFLNASHLVQTKPAAKGLTCRRVLQWIAQLAGSNVYADFRGEIRIAWLTETDIRITPANRYESELDDESVTVTGVQFTTTEGLVSFEGASGYVLNFEDNGLAEYVPLAPAATVAERMAGFTWRGFSASCRPLPYLWPMDVVTYVDRAGGEHRLVVGSVTYNANGQTIVSCEGVGNDTAGQSYPSGGNGSITAAGLEVRVLKLESQLADLLYDPIKITAFGVTPSSIRAGNTLSSVSLTWSFNKTPASVTLSDGKTETVMEVGSTGKTIDGTTFTGNETWTLKVTDERGTAAADRVGFNVLHGVYYGVGAARTAYNSDFVNSLSVEWRTNKKPSVTLSPSNQHIYYCLPVWMGTCTFTVGVFEGGFELAGTISHTNDYGYTQSCYVYRSVEALSGSITVKIS